MLAPFNALVAGTIVAAEKSVGGILANNPIATVVENKEEAAIENGLASGENRLATNIKTVVQQEVGPAIAAALAAAKAHAEAEAQAALAAMKQEFENEMANIGCCGRYKKSAPAAPAKVSAPAASAANTANK